MAGYEYVQVGDQMYPNSWVPEGKVIRQVDSQETGEAIRTFTGQDPAQAFVEANAVIVRQQQKIKSLEAEVRRLRRKSNLLMVTRNGDSA